MTLLVIYVVAAVVIVALVRVIAKWLGARDSPVAHNPALTALVAGLCWPVLLVGLVQFFMIVAVKRWARTRSRADRVRRAARAVRRL